MPFDPQGANKDKTPDLIAFRVPVDRSMRAMRFHALNDKGERLAGSERQIRVVGKIPSAGLLLVFALAPLLVMAIALFWRSRAYTAGRIDDS